MNFRQSIKRIYFLLQPRDRRKLTLLLIIQIALNLLDLAGVAIIGVLGALSVNGVQSRSPGTQVTSVLDNVGLTDKSIQFQVGALALAAAVLLISKTFIAVFLNRKSLYFLSLKSALVSKTLVKQVLSQSLTSLNKRGTQETIYVINSGVNSLILSVLGAGISVISDVSLLMILTAALYFVSPPVAITSVLFFGIIGIALFKTMHVRAERIGQNDASLSVLTNNKLSEVLLSYRESIVKNRRTFYAEEIGKLQQQHAGVLAERTFMPNISKYVIEVSVILGALMVSAVQFLVSDATHAIGSLAIFLAAGSRVAPAVLRIQQGLIQIKTSLGVGKTAFALIDDLKGASQLEEIIPPFSSYHPEFIPRVKVSSLAYQYPGNDYFGILDINFEVFAGQSVAIVGTSGAGKTTLIDLLLGVIKPTGGSISISDSTPDEVVKKWPGAIAYVPQDVLIVNGSIRENICLGYSANQISDDLVLQAVRNASLENFIESLPDGLDTQVGERGAKISGGQRQRLGIARALVSNPLLLVLDEATSSLDGETEYQITDSLQKVKGHCTVIMIAHRLSSIRLADLVIYMHIGSSVAQGSFNDIRREVPDFDRQASLMGL